MRNPFDAIPHINFVPKTTDEILAEMTASYEEEYYRQTGTRKTILPSSEERIFIYTQAYLFYLACQRIDRGLKMNLLKYSETEYLDNLAALFGLERLPAQPSVSRIRFSLSAAQPQAVHIPAGTRVTTQNRIYFRTQESVAIPAGASSAEVNIDSEEGGIFTVGLQPGQIHILVNPVPFVTEAVNTRSTQGGSDIESDESLRIKIYEYRNSYSVAGPRSAYRYFVKSYSQAIEGISVHSPAPGDVDIRLTLTGGMLPEEPFMEGLFEYLEDKRPQTDRLHIGAPDAVSYDLVVTWYLARSDLHREEEIRERVRYALEEYLRWQDSEIGRDLVPDALTQALRQAGAKRAFIVSPTFQVVDETHICRHQSVSAVFGGVEND